MYQYEFEAAVACCVSEARLLRRGFYQVCESQIAEKACDVRKAKRINLTITETLTVHL